MNQVEMQQLAEMLNLSFELTAGIAGFIGGFCAVMAYSVVQYILQYLINRKNKEVVPL